MAMRVSVCENNRSGKRHGMQYVSGGVRGRRYACGILEYVGDYDTLVGHYTDWRKHVTCKTCLRALEKMEAKRGGS
jgi:hypothetical protein